MNRGSRGRIWRLTATPSQVDGNAILLLEGRLGHTTAGELDSAARTLLAQGAQRLVFDLSKADYVSSAALRVIRTLSEELGARGGSLVLRNPAIPARQAIELAGLLNLVIG